MTEDFRILGIGPEATRAEIKAAYRRRARALHPDLRLIQGGLSEESDRPPAEPMAAEDAAAALTELTEARRRALAWRAETDRAAAGAHPGHSSLASPASAAPAAVPEQRSPQPEPAARPSAMGRTPTRDDDPMLALLTLPQRCSGVWPSEALEVWALSLVPAARLHLAEAVRAAEDAGAVTPRHRTAAAAHALLTLTLRERGGSRRRFAAVDPHLAAAYAAAERDLPATLVDRLPAKPDRTRPRSGTTLLAAVGGALAGGLVVWLDLPSRLFG